MSQSGFDAGQMEEAVVLAQQGDRQALESVVRAVQPQVFKLAQRFLWHPEDAEDATQEILIKIMTRLSSFRGESAFRTWIYRVASNTLLDIRKSRAEVPMTFQDFAHDLDQGLSDANVEESVLLEEVKVGCTLAMLLCLDRPHRMAFVLGEIMQFDHREAAAVLQIEPATFRKRLSRARRRIVGLMRAKCGLFDAKNACRCSRRVQTAIEKGRVDPEELLFASATDQVRRFPQVLDKIRALEEADRAGALYRSNQTPQSRRDFVRFIDGLLDV